MKKIFKHLLILSIAFLAACSITKPHTPDQEPEIPVVNEKYEIVGDNMHYTELQLGVSKTFSVIPKDLEEGSKAEGIVWYVNKTRVGTGVSHLFAPTSAGKYSIEYKIAKANSTTGKEQTKSFNVVAYDMEGVLLLEETLPDTHESHRGVSQHIFGTDDVSRYIKGDFKSFGTTSNYMQNWGKHIYNVSWVTTDGVALSKFTTDATPKMVGSVVAFDAPIKAFVGIDENIGVVTTSSASIIDLNTLAVKFTLKGSEGASNAFVADGYLFIITKDGAKAYSINGISAETEPKVLGAATVGFIQSMDGSVFAFNTPENSSTTGVLRININDLSVTEFTMPEGFVVLFSESPWRQYAMAASTKENAIFLMNDAGWGTGKSIHKYNVETGALVKNFITIPGGEWDNMLYGTSIVYNAQTDELICAVLKGFGEQYSNSTLYTFNASTGAQVKEVGFSTKGEGAKDMWANGTLAPIKTY